MLDSFHSNRGCREETMDQERFGSKQTTQFITQVFPFFEIERIISTDNVEWSEGGDCEDNVCHGEDGPDF